MTSKDGPRTESNNRTLAQPPVLAAWLGTHHLIFGEGEGGGGLFLPPVKNKLFLAISDFRGDKIFFSILF